MSHYKVNGGKPLKGTVKILGAKNASFKLMIAALLSDEETVIRNVPHIKDVTAVKDIIESLDGKVSLKDYVVKISPQTINSSTIPEKFGSCSRATSLFAGPLLSRFGVVQFPLPGGDKIGERPLDRHLAALSTLGVESQEENGLINLKTEGLRGGRYTFPKNSHTGTESLILASVKAEGNTTIENAAQEPEVDDLISFLNSMGAKINRIAPRTIEIEGVRHLHGGNYEVMPDRNEVVTFAIAALITKGECLVQGAREKDLEAFLTKLREANGGYEVQGDQIRFFYQGELKPTSITTSPYPGFMTDWQPLWVLLMVYAQGKSLIHEAVFESRWGYVPLLQQMGAKIDYAFPEISDPEEFYNFNWTEQENKKPHAIEVQGPTNLHGSELKITDIRAGATSLLAALAAQGESLIIDQEDHIERGYNNLDIRLSSLGGDIEKIK